MRNLFLFWMLVSFSPAFSQNLYDIANSKEFARYLYRSQQYSLASIELERLLFIQPENDTLRETLVRSYMLNKDYVVSIKRLDSFFPNPREIKKPFDDLFAYSLLADKKTERARTFLSSNETLEPEKRQYYQAFSYLLEQDYKQADKLLSEIPNTNTTLAPLRDLSKEGVSMRHKSGGLAMAMSAIVPGSGKFYTGDWKDGIISLISIGVTGYQAIHGFQVKGTKSAYGWIYGTIATGFYLGNIYGSFTSAKRFNKRQSDRVAQKVDAAFSIQP